jgi:hypothetical protein
MPLKTSDEKQDLMWICAEGVSMLVVTNFQCKTITTTHVVLFTFHCHVIT